LPFLSFIQRFPDYALSSVVKADIFPVVCTCCLIPDWPAKSIVSYRVCFDFFSSEAKFSVQFLDNAAGYEGSFSG
jgi:hypothetical protein